MLIYKNIKSANVKADIQIHSVFMRACLHKIVLNLKLGAVLSCVEAY